jgi:arylsulfatase A-like enzyme
MLKRLWLVLAIATCATAQQNVLLVVLDDVGVDHVSAYGESSASASTPVIDGLAQGGVLFRNAWANPCCSPTRATIQTGRYGFRTGIGFVVSKQGFDLPFEELILPEVLAAGVSSMRSAGFGKWHLANRAGSDFRLHPNESGYPHWAGAWSNLVPPFNYDFWIRTEDGLSAFTDVYATTDTVDSFLDWQATVSGPWFGYVAFHAAHEPFHAPPAQLHNVPLPQVDPRDKPLPFYRAAVEALDTELGRLLTGLGSELANTNVIVIGDNGTPHQVSVPPFLGSHAKLTPFEGGINVPLIISGPAVAAGGREVEALVNAVDLFTTTLELAGLDPAVVLPTDREYDSVSVVPYLQSPSQAPLREWVYSELWNPNGGAEKQNDWRMLRDERFKVIRYTKPRAGTVVWSMFDLELDPFETRDLLDPFVALNPLQQAHLASLRATLTTLLDE